MDKEYPQTQDQSPYPYNQGYAVPPPPAYYSTDQQQPTTVVVSQPAQYYSAPVQPVGVQPSDYLILSIFTILCCCWPVGIIALVKSVETRNHWQSGRYVEAKTSSQEAKKFNMLGIILGIVINVVAWAVVILAVVIQVAVGISANK